MSSDIASNFAKSLAFGDDAMNNSRIKEWYNRFKDGRTSVDREPRSGRPSTSRNENVIEQVQTLVRLKQAMKCHTGSWTWMDSSEKPE
jgi:transposase